VFVHGCVGVGGGAGTLVLGGSDKSVCPPIDLGLESLGHVRSAERLEREVLRVARWDCA
jgi:hypothetical protein